MQTELMRPDELGIFMAADLLRSGGLVAFPTETVYGLGAKVYNEAAVAAIFEAKGRPADNPLIAHVLGITGAQECGEWTPLAQILASAFWPGPLTLIIRRKPIIPRIVSAGLDTIALRAPSHPVARALIAACGFPIAAPSANRSGRPSPTTAAHVMDDLAGRIPLILDGGPSEVGLESTVVDATGMCPLVLRPGSITPQMLATVAGECQVADSVMRQLQEGEYAPSPGMRHKHYAPMARLTLVEGEDEAVKRVLLTLAKGRADTWVLALDGELRHTEGLRFKSLGRDAGEAAHRLFYLLRQADEEGVQRIFVKALSPEGVGLAVMNRLARASGFDIIQAAEFNNQHHH
ncbi:MAG TPA: threonylcarbamoyl-AMP synthase [Clostridiales bacterium]|nr:threonylcarbamoyl-AMP synthase [Clostridiales bacterium]